MNQIIRLISNGINHKNFIFSFCWFDVVVVVSLAGHNSSKITWHIGPLSIRWHLCLKLLSPNEKKNEMKHYGIALAPNLIFIVWAREINVSCPSHLNMSSAALRTNLSTWAPLDISLSKRRKKSGTQTDNNCINGLWLKDQRLHGKGKRYHGQRSVAQDIRRNSEIYLF